ncbi:MAG: IS1380 family transposase [Candidatus Falkowbacteria bacterium]
MNFPVDKNTELKVKNSSLVELFPIQGKKVELSYSGEDISSDGGLLLLNEVEKQTGIIEGLTNCIKDERDQRYVQHTLAQLLSQRIYQIAAGYEDANDCNDLRSDAILKICAGQLPENDPDLASQPTMSRFENSVSRSDLYRIAECFGRAFINSYETEPAVIIIDCDDTNNNAYGNQLLIEFNNYYGEYCFMPLHIYEGLSGKLITTILKPGRRSKGVDVFSILKRIVNFIRSYWQETKIIIRGDSHFCSPEFMNWAKRQYKVNFITGLTGNKKLNEFSKITVNSAEKSYKQGGKPVKMYHTFQYGANTWDEEQRVIVKVEVNEMGTNIRYIVTDLWDFRTRQLYELGYCARGGMELRIKEHKTYLKSDRTSCNKFEANQLRLFMHSAAYVLLHTLQKEVLQGTQYFNATIKTLQLKLIKVAAYVKEMKTKIKIEFPRSCPVKEIQINAFEIFEVLRC